MDAITHDIQRPAPYTLLYADDVFLASDDKTELSAYLRDFYRELAFTRQDTMKLYAE